MNTGQRIAIFRKSLNLTQQKLADKIGINRAYLGHIEAGRQEPSYNFIKALSDSFNINLNWLLAGEGEMCRTLEAKTATQTDPKLATIDDVLEGLNELQRQEIYTAIEKEKWLNQLKHEVDELKQMIGKK